MDQQFRQVFDEFESVKLPYSFKNIDKILVCAMGGSGLGADLVRSVFDKYLRIPILIVNDYKLPAWVDQKTLIVLSSFSGETEEVISCYQEAQKKKFKIFITGSKGKLSKINAPRYFYKDTYNYALNPRFAIGYSIAIFVSLFKKLEILDFDLNKIKKGLVYLNKTEKISDNLAGKVFGKMPIIISSEHLSGNAHVFSQQTDETGKNFSCYFFIPELFHLQFEGMTFPKIFKKDMIYILINSKLYYSRNQKRYKVMKAVLKKRGIKFMEIMAEGDDVWSQSMYILGLSSYFTFYLAYYNKIDPQPQPWVDLLKEMIKK